MRATARSDPSGRSAVILAGDWNFCSHGEMRLRLNNTESVVRQARSEREYVRDKFQGLFKGFTELE